jgi:two-component system chemotaxis sensor kinase CheA
MNVDKHKEIFKEEAYELLGELESALLELEDAPEDAELIGRVFRALHTIKGSGSMFGFDDIAAFAHEVETVFDLVRNGGVKVTKELIDLTLVARDQIRAMLDSADGGEAVNSSRTVEIVESFRKFVPEAGEKPDVPVSRKGIPVSDVSEKSVTYRIRFRSAQDIFMRGTNPVYLLEELCRLGDCKVVAHTDAIPVLNDFDPEACYTYWDVILTTNQGINAIKDVFIFVEDDSELKIEVIDEGGDFDVEAGYKKLGEILIERGDLTPEDLEKVLSAQKRVGEMLVDAGVVDEVKVKSALVEQEHVIQKRKERKAVESASSIRVPAEKLDTLVDLVGELVTVQARLSQTVLKRGIPELLSISEEVERLTEELRDNAMSIRMVPIGTTFSKFRRLVRDLSRELGKEVELTTEGAETELDKTVIERLNDPLVHLIRNSIDHGIEPPDVREARGKPRKGTVHLSAVHSGASVLIEIRDDGAGLDAEAIRAKALERGLIAPDAELSEKDIFSLILVPGFSTAEEVTNVSGRGVGMDVVKKSIETLRGSIGISSKKGVGTTITLKLPLTLAIIEGLLVRIGQEYFIMPLSVVEECVELTREDVAKAHGRHIANVRGELIPYVRLREYFRIGGQMPDIEQVVITRTDGSRVGFVVDNVIGEHQTVIKSLGRFYRAVEGISGATILGDGTVALILDVHQLVQGVEREEEALFLKHN